MGIYWQAHSTLSVWTQTCLIVNKNTVCQHEWCYAFLHTFVLLLIKYVLLFGVYCLISFHWPPNQCQIA